MASTLSQILDLFTPDPWRAANPFSAEVDGAHESLFSLSATKQQQQQVINNWIQRHQPCLFGRAAAAQAALHYCLLTENDLRDGDAAVRERIQDAHLRWTRETFEGRSSGFIVLLISERVARAEPNPQVLAFATLLARLYLQEDAIKDRQDLPRQCLLGGARSP
jgi:hypothetical protein